MSSYLYQKGNENVLYSWSSLHRYLPAQAVKCDMCGQIFQVKKGFLLLGETIACYKHMKKEWLEEMGFDVTDK